MLIILNKIDVPLSFNTDPVCKEDYIESIGKNLNLKFWPSLQCGRYRANNALHVFYCLNKTNKT